MIWVERVYGASKEGDLCLVGKAGRSRGSEGGYIDSNGRGSTAVHASTGVGGYELGFMGV